MNNHVVEIQLEAQVQWRAEPGAGKGVWVGICDALNLSVEANSLDELHSLIPESIHLLMVDLVLDNEFDTYLSDRGWKARGIPQQEAAEQTEFHVPWELLVAAGQNGFQRRAH
jgi:hypothetical protein